MRSKWRPFLRWRTSRRWYVFWLKVQQLQIQENPSGHIKADRRSAESCWSAAKQPAVTFFSKVSKTTERISALCFFFLFKQRRENYFTLNQRVYSCFQSCVSWKKCKTGEQSSEWFHRCCEESAGFVTRWRTVAASWLSEHEWMDGWVCEWASGETPSLDFMSTEEDSRRMGRCDLVQIFFLRILTLTLRIEEKKSE